MFIQATQIIGHGLVALETRELIGKVDRLIFDPTNGRLLALAISPKGLFRPKMLLAVSDIIGIEPGFVLTRQSDDLVEPKELVRAFAVMKDKTPIIRQTAQTESGQKLGEINDLLLDTEAWVITKYYVHHILSERIFVAEDVREITKKAIVFFDRVNGPISAATEVETAMV
jgi:uncharacterized protein YrrD